MHAIKFVPGCNTGEDTVREQFKKNINRSVPKLRQCELISLKRKVAVVCGGPSLEKYWHELVDYDGTIIACNGAYQFLLDRDIIPDYFMLLDCRRENIDFLKNLEKSVLYCICAQAHPCIFDHLENYGANTLMYFTNLPDIQQLIPDEIKSSKVAILGGNVGTVGIKAMSLAYTLGYREMHLYGYDSSYANDKHHAYSQPLNDETKKIEVFVDGKPYITSATLAHQAQEFCSWAKDLTQFHGCSIYLHCEGLLSDLVQYSNKVGEEKSLEQREKEKYEKIWKHDNYRKNSPGEKLVDFAFTKMGMQRGDSLIDFGCGTGRAANKFMNDYGMRVVAIDHTSSCVDKDIDINFVEKCLWDKDTYHPFGHWGYCTDVMEHIPPEKVVDVLEIINKHVKNGCFFQIATREDTLGALIGRKLHMTVATADAWYKVLKNYFSDVEMIEKEGEAIYCCYR